MNMTEILLRTPINKVSAKVTNQCGCADELQLNGLIEQRAQLKASATTWMRQSAEGGKGVKRQMKELIRQANKDLLALNKQLKPYDQWHRRNTPKGDDKAFRAAVYRVFGKDIYEQLEIQAQEIKNK